MNKGPQADASQVQQLRSKVAQTEASVGDLQGQLSKMSRDLGLAREEVVRLRGELKFTQVQGPQEMKLLSTQAQGRVAALMSDKKGLVAKIATLERQVAEGRDDLQRNLQESKDQMETLDRKLSGEFSRGFQSGEMAGKHTGAQEAQKEAELRIDKISQKFEAKMASYEKQLADQRLSLSKSESALQSDLTKMRGQLSQAEAAKSVEAARAQSSAASLATAQQETTRERSRADVQQAKVDQLNTKITP